MYLKPSISNTSFISDMYILSTEFFPVNLCPASSSYDIFTPSSDLKVRMKNAFSPIVMFSGNVMSVNFLHPLKALFSRFESPIISRMDSL